MRRYETICIIKPGVSEEDINVIVDRTTETIVNDGGHIVNIDKWGLKKLAYIIKKENQGYYVYIEYAGMPDSVSEIERIFRIDDKILKYMTVKTQETFIADAPVEETAEEAETAPDEAEAEA